MEISYDYTRSANGVLEIDDIFNCGLELTSYNAESYFVVTRTKHGYTSIMTFGPVALDIDFLPKNVLCTYKKIASQRNKIEKEIDKFINDIRKDVQLVEEKPITEILDICDKFDIINYMRREEL